MKTQVCERCHEEKSIVMFRAREIRQELRDAEETARTLALDALNTIDLSGYPTREQKAIAHEMRLIKDGYER